MRSEAQSPTRKPARRGEALFLDLWRARHSESLLGFQVLFGLSSLLRLGASSLLLLLRKGLRRRRRG